MITSIFVSFWNGIRITITITKHFMERHTDRNEYWRWSPVVLQAKIESGGVADVLNVHGFFILS
ncbi:hypothetical protein [Fulvivirga sediminis]|uniref:Uncharacterized protein n=1 Tax=Fulvivirga sediminis TaxID=2803949 RepID=A0A937FDA6_9BACT|nr:hypothetical protein [Fulvivirga sediminis]MBL3658800.1 hypothetical protein [Fulvivirga sediminis]